MNVLTGSPNKLRVAGEIPAIQRNFGVTPNDNYELTYTQTENNSVTFTVEQSSNGTTGWSTLMNTTSTNGTHTRNFTPTQAYLRVKYSGSAAFSLANMTLVGTDTDTSYSLIARGDYRYGFNSMEKDDELKGSGNSYDFGARMYDSRLGRWLTIDPLAGKQPSQSPYKAFLNNPNLFVDPNGETEYHINVLINEKTGKAVITVTVASSDVMTDGVKHTIWDSQATSHQENFYYDFAKVTVTTISKKGKIKVQESTQIIKGNGEKRYIKDYDYVLFGGDKKYDTHSEWYTPKDLGVEVSFGINMGGSTGGSGAIGQDWSKNAVGSVSFDDLSAILSRSSISGGYSPGSGSWHSLTKGQVQDFLKTAKESVETGNKIGEAYNETKKAIIKTDSCEVCGQIGTEDKMKSESWHGSLVKRKGYEKKQK
ncbi:RHS repeat-associated core domain-containing protein [Fluviicola taffensis]|uniref:RHS repeat-associated core domain protein n=1 Tax=Fluviicola taffensis (strain DSM 16823 / NCIMB 13979 / RW262) TaxID=755732 RepID=F2IDK3_FLUTR|nr:RHS repeat-associated core domain-containing protein [Fluviicola taffensis]AEA43376.1 RHS repeat-associated core domain protein [Fluviicola taffensis DSM 16823]